MEPFGQALRSERERRGVALESISATTRIALRHLEALEADEYRLLPGGVFRKGIARNYIDALGLDAGEWMEHFEICLREQGVSAEIEGDLTQFIKNVKRGRGTVRRRMRGRWLGVLALLGALGGLAYLAWHYVLAGRISF